MKERIILLIAGITMISILFIGCSKNDDESEPQQETLPELMDYWGKWDITSVSATKSERIKLVNPKGEVGTFKEPTTAKGQGNLTFYSSSQFNFVSVGDNLNAGDYLYVGWCTQNNGSETIQLSTNTIAVYLDGTNIANLVRNFFYLEPSTYINDVWGSYIGDASPPTLTEGSHTLRVVLDANNVFAEANENDNEYTITFDVSAPEIDYPEIDLAKSYFWAKDQSGILHFGTVSGNASSLTLSDIGFTMKNITVSGNTISFEVSDGLFKTTRVYTGTRASGNTMKTDMVTRLTYDSWTLDDSKHPNPQTGQKWVFSQGGHYTFINTEGSTEQYDWAYISETSFTYMGGVGTATITDISNNYMRIEDTGGYWYEFSR